MTNFPLPGEVPKAPLDENAIHGFSPHSGKKLVVWNKHVMLVDWKKRGWTEKVMATFRVFGHSRYTKDIAKVCLQRGIIDGNFIDTLREYNTRRWFPDINPRAVDTKTIDMLAFSNEIIESAKRTKTLDVGLYADRLRLMTPTQRDAVMRTAAVNLRDLTSISFAGCGDMVSSKMLVSMLSRASDRLTHINLSGCTAIGDGDILTLARHRALTTINMSGTQVTNQLISFFAEFPALREVSFAGCKQIDHTVLQAFAERSWPVKKIDLSHCPQVFENAEFISTMTKKPADTIVMTGSKEIVEALAKLGVKVEAPS